MRSIILSALLAVASLVFTAAQGSGTVGYSRTTLDTAPTNLNFRAATVTSKITNASIYGITGILKGDGIGGSVLAVSGVDYEAPGGGGGTTVSVNGSAVATPNFTNSATATFSVSTTNVSVNPTNLANAQIAAGAAIDFSKLSGVAASVHVHAGEDITSGTVADARVAATIARDSEVTSAISALTLSGISGAVTDSQVPNDITIDLATVATTANAGDSATSFFPSGTIEDARLPGTMAGKTLTTPTIADFSNATHNHQNVAGGGTLDGAAIAIGTVAAARIDSAIATDAEVAAGFQPLDSDLTALAGNGSTGLLARTGSGTVAARTITGDSEITVSNGDGVSGNPTLAIASSIARDSEVSAAYQPLDADLTDLADGSLTGSKVGTGIDADNITGGTITGSGGLVRATSPTIVTPTIASFENANHNHQNSAGGGTLDAAAIATGVLGTARLGAGGAYHGAILTPWVATDNSVSLQWKKAPQVWEFDGIIGEWTVYVANSGSGSLNPGPQDTAESGLWSAVTGSLTNGIAGYRLTATSFIFQTNKQAVMVRMKTPPQLSTDVDGYELFAGFGDTQGTENIPHDGAYFYYLHSVSNGVWNALTINNGVSSFATGAPTTPPAVVAGTWYNLLAEGSMSLVNFWVSSNDGATWQFIGASSSNIPQTAPRVFSIQFGIRKVGGSVGTASRTCYIGRVEHWPAIAN